MELGSEQHKQLLFKSLLKVALKTSLLGLIVGLFLMIPYIFRENLFSIGLFYFGTAIIVITTLFSAILAYKKYQKMIKNFS